MKSERLEKSSMGSSIVVDIITDSLLGYLSIHLAFVLGRTRKFHYFAQSLTNWPFDRYSITSFLVHLFVKHQQLTLRHLVFATKSHSGIALIPLSATIAQDYSKRVYFASVSENLAKNQLHCFADSFRLKVTIDIFEIRQYHVVQESLEVVQQTQLKNEILQKLVPLSSS